MLVETRDDISSASKESQAESQPESLISGLLSGWINCTRNLFQEKGKSVRFAEPEINSTETDAVVPASRNFVTLVCRSVRSLF